MTTETATSTNKPQDLLGDACGSIPLAPQGWSFIIATALGWTITATILSRKIES